MKIDNRFTKIPLSELTTPKNGHVVITNSFWVVVDGNAFTFRGAPQCNASKEVAEKVYPDYDYVFLDVAYLPNRR